LHPPDQDDCPSLRQLAAGIFLLSYGVLSIEIAFTRIFSMAISYHFAYVTIATALLGFGSAGSLLAVFRPASSIRRRLVVSGALAGLAAIAALAFSSVVRLDPAVFGNDAAAIVTLTLYGAVITVPFFFAGAGVVTVLSAMHSRVGILYGLDLAGAALGCALSVPVIWAVGTPAAVVLGAAAMAASGLPYVRGRRQLALVSLASAAVALTGGALVDRYGPFPPSPEKFLAQFLASPGSHHLFERWTPINRVDAVGWDRTETSWAGSYALSGAGKGSTARAPEFRMVGYDGGSFAVMYQWDGKDESLDMFRHHLMAAPYRIMKSPETLVIGLGGGADALAGIANGAGPMTGLELNPVTIELGRDRFRDFNGDLFRSPRLTVVNAEARHWIEANRERKFDLIELNSIDTLSALSSGAYVLAESYLYTTDAFTRYLEQLKPGGTFALFSFDNFGVAAPTYIILRFATTIERALAATGAKDPKSQMVILASAGTTPLVTTLVKREPFTATELSALESFAAAEGFSFWHEPGAREPHKVSEFLALDAEGQQSFIANHYLRLDPVADSSPFFFNFYTWKGLVFPRADDARTTPATGQRILLVMLVESIVVSLAMIVWPLTRLRGSRAVRKPFGLILYFSALGLGFMLLEITLLQRFVLFLGYPTYSLSVVMCSLLVSAGAGSMLSERLPLPARTAILVQVSLLVVLVGLFDQVASSLISANLSASLATRIAISVALLAPLGLVLGTFFPTGIRIVAAIDERLIPWAWAVNGCTTVIGTVVAIVLAMTYGFPFVAAWATLVYVIGAAGLLLTERAA
jgi:predicted membrane-bound spermidine synthase